MLEPETAPDRPARRKARRPKDPAWVRIFMALLGSVIIGFIMYVVLNPSIGRDALGSTMVKALFAVACGLLGGFFSGSLTIDGKLPGLALRAGGGLALGVLVFIYVPKVADAVLPPEPGGVNVIDFRSSESKDGFALGRNRGQLIVTTELSIRNLGRRNLVWRGSSAVLKLAGAEIPFRAQYFTNFVDATNPWLGTNPSPATPLNVPPGSIAQREVMFMPTPPGRFGWDDFLKGVTSESGAKPIFEVRLEVADANAGSKSIAMRCVGQIEQFADELRDYVKKSMDAAPRATLGCDQAERGVS